MSSKTTSSRLHTIIKAAAVAVLLPVAAVYFVVARPEFKILDGITHAVMPIFHGIGNVITWPVRAGGNLMRTVYNISNLEQENEELRARLATALMTKTECDVAIHENKRLAYELGVKQASGYNTVIADIMFDNSAVGHETFLINRGTRDGVSAGMIVVSFNNAMMGIVIDSGTDFARVRALGDSGTNIAVRVAGSDVYGFLRGNGSDTPTIGFFSDPKFQPAPGIKIVTSNISGVLPPNVFVGTMQNEADVEVNSPGEQSRVMVLKFNTNEGKYK